jgi:hypothetical protein
MAKTAPKAETLTAVEIALRLLETVQALLECTSDQLAGKKGGK